MKLLSSGQALSSPASYLDVGNAVVINGSVYDKASYRPQALNFVQRSTGTCRTSSMFNYYNYITNTSNKASITKDQQPLANYVAESLIRDSVNPDVYYIIRSDMGTASADVLAGAKSTTSNNIIDVGTGPSNNMAVPATSATKVMCNYILKQTTDNLFWVRTTCGTAAPTNSVCQNIVDICYYDKTTGASNYIALPGTTNVLRYATSGSTSLIIPIILFPVPSVVYDTDTEAIIAIHTVQYVGTTTTNVSYTLLGVVYVRLNKLDRTITDLGQPAPTSGTFDYYYRSNATPMTNALTLYKLMAGHSSYAYEHTDGNLYAFHLHSQDMKTLERTMFMLGFDKDDLSTFASCDAMTVDWTGSNFTSFPTAECVQTNNVNYPTTTAQDIWHSVQHAFVTEASNGTKYLNVAFLDAFENEKVCINTFSIDIANKALTWQATSRMPTNILGSIMFVDNVRYGGKNSKFVTHNGSNRLVVAFNELTKTWDVSSSKSNTALVISLDEEGSIIESDASGNVWIESLTGNVSIEWDFETTTIITTPDPTTSYITAKAINYMGEQVAQDVEFTIAGPAKWLSNDQSTIVVSLPVTGEATVQFITTSSKAGKISVSAKPVVT